MRKIIVENYQEMSAVGAALIARQLWDKPDSVLGLATGGTPVGLYQCLVSMYRNGALDFSRAVSFNLDEYYPIRKDNDQSYDYFMRKNLFDHVNIANIHIPNGETKDPEAECAAYDRAIELAGGIDIQLLGIGVNGHIGFNEPDTELHTATHITGLTESTIEANARYFENLADMPRQALTMGLGAILSARRILLLASGAGKATVMKKLFAGKLSTATPATALALHPDVTVVMDKAAAGL